ncbi:MAG: hypothetical protein LQ343_005246 [Gyalolechia ehrenbergii]|nr:MAG: hypothetical protein LQ343_005246 [Gyalolechia ehrenbergii]
MAQVPPFGVILPSRPVITNPVTVSTTQYAFVLPSIPSFSHVVVFIVPGNPLPMDTLAAIYIQFPGPNPEFKLLGAIGNDKQTAVFRVKNDNIATGTHNQSGTEDEMIDADGPNVAIDGASTPAGDTQQRITIGISIEPAATIEAQLASSSTLVLANKTPQQQSPVSAKVLAQRIIKNAFNFLASFAGQTTVGGEEMVPLRSFRGWWEKFERRVENDPGFLEREVDG